MTTPFSSCSRCGFQTATGARFCPNCGGTMAESTESIPRPMAATATASSGAGMGTVPPPPFPAATLLCSRCGAEFSVGAKFCPNCGTFAGSAPPRPNEYTAPHPGPGAVPPPRMAAPFFCARCGAQYSAGATICPQCGNRAGVAQVVSSGQSPYAGFWIRFVADCIDTVIMIVVFFLFSWLPIANIAISVIVICLYGAMTESSTQQASLGKRALGLKVSDLEGRRISFGRGFARWLVKEILSFPIFWPAFLVIVFSQKKQGVHDLMAGTLVWRAS